jgi:hypothetical protein
MEDLKIINKRGPIDHVYIAGMNETKVGIHAPTLAAAKQKAVEHFRPKKKQLSLIWVEFAEE